MLRGRAFTSVAALTAVIVLGGAVLMQRESIAAWWRSRTVRKLLDPAQREFAYREILRWQRYRGVPLYKVDPPYSKERIDKVIVCPQPDGKPVFAVVFRSEPYEEKEKHFELVDFDGTLIPVFEGANSSPCDFRDLNGDGVLDWLESMEWEIEGEKRSISTLTLIPLTREQEPALRIVYPTDGEWIWTVSDASAALPEISLGPREATNGVKARAVYRWEPSRSDYVGPAGGMDEDFLRVDGDVSLIESFALHAESGSPR